MLEIGCKYILPGGAARIIKFAAHEVATLIQFEFDVRELPGLPGEFRGPSRICGCVLSQLKVVVSVGLQVICQPMWLVCIIPGRHLRVKMC